MKLAFGYNDGIPEDIKTAWGARLIAPADLLWDRQDLVAESDEAKQRLVGWLNGEGESTGAIAQALKHLRRFYRSGNAYSYSDADILGNENREHVLHEDALGKIVGNTNASYGYVYVTGWLKPIDHEALRAIRRSTAIGRAHDEILHPVYIAQRVRIPADRWERVYGWSAEQAAEMDGTSSEVRLFRGDEEIQAYVADAFEFGYGGSGPHALARAIVEDLGVETNGAPASYAALVPEVFGAAQGKDEVVVYADNVLRRALDRSDTVEVRAGS